MLKFGMVGKLNIKKYEKDKLIDEYNFNNLITNRGLEHILRIIGGDASGGINRIGLGTSQVPPSFSDTSLYNRVILVNVNRDYTDRNKITFLASIPENTFNRVMAYTEGGLISRSDSGSEILITRLLFDNIVYQNPNHSLSLSYSLEIQRGVNFE